MGDIFLAKKDWEKFNETELQNYVVSVFLYYREHGFPYFPTDANWRKDEFQKYWNYDNSTVIEGDVVRQTMHGLSFCWSYMPHSYNVKCNDKLTPLEAFNDDEKFKKVIRKRLNFGDNISDNGIRKMLKIFTGVQCVSNFRPTAACAIYEKFAKGKVVWDMSSGYGGRMIGAIKAGVSKYIGCEPCTQTYNGLLNIKSDLQNWFGISTDIELHKIGSECLELPNNSVDFCFTSPPYFNTEKYSDEETQSCNRYTERETWLNDFLKKTFTNAYNCLVNDGIMAINIANVKSYKTLEEDTIKVAKEVGFELMQTMRYSLSSLSHNDKFKYEPIFLFRKNK